MAQYKINIEKRISKDKLIVDAKRLGEKDPVAHMSDLADMEIRITDNIHNDLNDLKIDFNNKFDDLKELIIANK